MTTVTGAPANVDGTESNVVTMPTATGIQWYQRSSTETGNDMLVSSRSIAEYKAENTLFFNDIRLLNNEKQTPYVLAVNRNAGGGTKLVYFSKSGKFDVKKGDLLSELKGITIQHRLSVDEETGEPSEYYLIAKETNMDMFA